MKAGASLGQETNRIVVVFLGSGVEALQVGGCWASHA